MTPRMAVMARRKVETPRTTNNIHRMNVKTAKKAGKRIDTGYVRRFQMQGYGNDNLYPQKLRDITMASGTAELCLSRYSRFIEGYGFNSEAISELIMNASGETADNILHAVSQDLARYGGFALHVNYNVLCEVVSVEHVPFENCRLEEEDDAGYVAHILLHPDWTGEKTRSGKLLRVDESRIERICVFNPDKSIVAREIEDAGGIDNYKGQVLWVSKDGRCVYPTPIYDSAITEVSTDEGLANVKYRNVRNGFMVSCMLVTKKGVPKIDGDENEVEGEAMISPEDLRDFQGDEKACKIMLVELENDEDEPKVVAFPTRNFDKEFSITDSSVTERIYAQFHQELFYAIRIGKLGFSGQVMKDAYEYYAGEVTMEQRIIERAFANVMAVWHDEVFRGVDYVLQPLKYISSENINNNTIENE